MPRHASEAIGGEFAYLHQGPITAVSSRKYCSIWSEAGSHLVDTSPLVHHTLGPETEYEVPRECQKPCDIVRFPAASIPASGLGFNSSKISDDIFTAKIGPGARLFPQLHFLPYDAAAHDHPQFRAQPACQLRPWNIPVPSLPANI